MRLLLRIIIFVLVGIVIMLMLAHANHFRQPPIGKVRRKEGIIKWVKSGAVCQAFREVVPSRYLSTLK